MIERIAVFLCVFIFALFTAQTSNDVEILREDILDKMQYENHQVEPLLKYYSKISPGDAQVLRIKSLLIKGNYEEALNSLLALKNLATKDKNADIFLQYQYLYAELCQVLGLTSELHNIRNTLQKPQNLKGRTFTDLAIDKASFEVFSSSDRISILRSGINNYKNTGENKALIQSYLWLAELMDKNKKESISASNSANLLLTYKPGVYYEILVSNYLAKHELNKNNPKAAYLLLERFQNSAAGISNIRLKADYYKNLAQASAGANDFNMLGSANDAYFRTIENIEAKKSVAKALLVNHISKMNEEKLVAQKQMFRYIYLAIILVFIIVIISIYWLAKYKSRFAKDAAVNTEVKNFVIPDKTEKRILNKLDEFEKSQKYIQKTVSLKTLAQQFDTNPKYLSEVVNKHKNSNFNTYINNLRIDYIVDKIRKDPEYRKYKVSYLADECGFSSHSLFTTIFKNRMSLSPTEFLQKLNE